MSADYIAIDLGASSGRLINGEYDGSRIKLKEIHRFINEPVKLNGVLYWDLFRLFHEIKEGLKKAAAAGIAAVSVGVDTWGVDYGLIDGRGNIIGYPINYRDARTDNAINEVSEMIPLGEIYNTTGIQFMYYNTIFQLYADFKMRPDIIKNADKLLMTPDLINFLLSGEKLNEYTILSTSQLLNAADKKPDAGLLKKLNIPESLFCEMVTPGNMIGGFTDEIADETGLKNVKVIAVGCHDTASAVAGTPLSNDNAAYLSCGTWSLLGVETKAPIISDESFKYNFTNEGGVENTIRFLKNINGLWIIQQLRKSYNESNRASLGFGDIIAGARAARNKDLKIDAADPVFNAPQDMCKTIAEHLIKSGQGKPDGLGELALAVYNGITDEYAGQVENLQRLTGKRIDKINMIGGGIQDEFLCEMSASKTGRTIEAGPVEASVLGNMIMQLKATGEISGLGQGREIIADSFERRVYG